ncbi:hypothetical protein, partial [Chryseobacterium indoltheticum]|uniref:hypothetical protein n=1 Tax=Chryseobacterium indoltheticum TaxID=254 RepID=UPI003F499CB4
ARSLPSEVVFNQVEKQNRSFRIYRETLSRFSCAASSLGSRFCIKPTEYDTGFQCLRNNDCSGFGRTFNFLNSSLQQTGLSLQ